MGNCKICGKRIVLVPSAAERARKDVTGKSAKYYESLFTSHADCFLAKRDKETRELMKQIREQEK
jgi:hypothetical protein